MPDVSLSNAAQTALVASSHNAGQHSGIPSASPRSLHTRSEQSMSEGPQGTFEALHLMRAAVRGEAPPDFSGYQDPWIKDFVSRILRNANAQRGSIDGAYAIFYFVRDVIDYFDHPAEEQVVQDARRTIELGHGDCVSQSVLLATLLAAAGYCARFAVQMSSIPEGYNHVYIDLIYDDQIIALDPIADSKEGRPLGSPGWSQMIPDGGFETTFMVF